MSPRGKPEDKCVTPAKGPILAQEGAKKEERPAGEGEMSGGMEMKVRVEKPPRISKPAVTSVEASGISGCPITRASKWCSASIPATSPSCDPPS